MNYTSRYNLEFNPFIKNSKETLIETDEYKEVTFRLNYLLQTKGFGVLTGGPGKGKTTIIRNWTKSLNSSAYKVIYLSLSTLTVNDFYRHLAEGLNQEPKFRKTDNFKAIQDAINRLVVEKKITPIIIVDEANYLKNSTLNDLKILFNFDMDSSDKAIVLLTGLPQLNNTLNLNVHEPLRQRITMNYNLDGLSKEESKKYILDKLKAAGSETQVFESNALEAIINASNGVPRIINKICNQSLLIANSANLNTVDEESVLKALNDIELE